MGVAIKLRKGTAAEHTTFAGAEAEVTVQKSDIAGDPWTLRVHDGLGGTGHHIPTEDSVATLTNKTLSSYNLSGTISDDVGNLIATVSGGKLVFEPGSLTLDAPTIVDQGKTVAIEQMVARIARKNQMILGD
ncbi:MAG: hypothetical protein HN726_04695 [Candidatus Magasanikbacteria bacterium]|jgi:hypothetical protein|nr:hypothetical protein [Candidatus Magasanikbacteria bacterium]